jgi:hypothetical protein
MKTPTFGNEFDESAPEVEISPKIFDYEGVFVYDYFIKKTKRLYKPTKDDSVVSLEKWIDNEHIIFNNLDGSGIIELDIKTGDTMPIKY